jgi:hypothetical protein
MILISGNGITLLSGINLVDIPILKNPKLHH